jgi:hypothetical protein
MGRRMITAARIVRQRAATVEQKLPVPLVRRKISSIGGLLTLSISDA